MVSKGVIGKVVFVIVLLAGHTLNLAINLLGAYVHTGRLQFIEFFSKFYEGNGVYFKPLQRKNKYTQLAQNKN